MNNFQKIKAMDIDEMAEWLTDRSACDTCVNNMEEYKCMAVGCLDGIKQWLELEARE